MKTKNVSVFPLLSSVSSAAMSGQGEYKPIEKGVNKIEFH
jgi:hypothetical protein